MPEKHDVYPSHYIKVPCRAGSPGECRVELGLCADLVVQFLHQMPLILIPLPAAKDTPRLFEEQSDGRRSCYVGFGLPSARA